ncbi:hypothetical protein JL720_10043 [Aureococcus anophagefferens]|nr:hypothetical protein JL720_10043 [Aureococcus anophagefferens]
MVSSTALVVAGSAGAGAPAAPAAPATCATFDSPAALEAAVARSSRGAGDLFGGDDAFAPAPPVADALRAKIASKVKGDFGDLLPVAGGPAQRVVRDGRRGPDDQDLGSGQVRAGAEGGLKLTLTGHINAIRGLAVSARTTYMFSAGEDKKVMCWDLETNKVVRHYHGHLSGVYSLALHPTLDLLMTGGRDSCVRVWDVRTSKQVMMLGGHVNTIGAIACNASDPRSSRAPDCTFSFASGAADNIKKWQCKDGAFLRNLSGHDAIVNAVDVNDDGPPRHLRGGQDAKIWKEDTHATPDSDPVDMAAWTKECRRLKRC